MKRTPSILLVLFLLTGAAINTSAGSTDARILQLKLGRLYFNVGTESFIYPGHHFAILHGRDTVVTGVIEESYDGVSIGRAGSPRAGKVNVEKDKGVIETAETERMTLVRVGMYSLGNEIGVAATDLDAGYFDSNDKTAWVDRYVEAGDTILVLNSNDTLSLFDKLDRHLIDAVAFLGSSRARSGYQVFEARADDFVALLANPAHEMNQGGVLSTSLYYRFDPTRIQSPLTHPCDPVGSFLSGDSTQERPYPYDPSKGKDLFKRLRTKPDVVRICSHDDLKPVALYLADVLAREQCRTEVVPDTGNQMVDIDIDRLLPDQGIAEASELFCLRYHNEHRGGPPGLPPELQRLNDLRIAIDSLRPPSENPDTLRLRQLLAEGNRMLIQEMGCFPLFRPMVTLVTRKDVSGIRLDPEGNVAVSEPRRIVLPEAASKDSR